MSILGWIILGGLAGWLASIIMGTRGQGCFVDIIVGIIGAIVGGFLFSLIGGARVTGFNLHSLFVAFVGAVVLLAIVKALRGRRTY